MPGQQWRWLYSAPFSDLESGGGVKGKTCLVTGANRGIGRATAEALASQGATVLLHCRTRAAGEVAREEIVAATGNDRLEVLVADLAVHAQVRRLAAEVQAAHHRLDVLVSLVEAREARHVPLEAPDPIAAIVFMMEQKGLSRRDLEPAIGSRARVAEILNRRRALTLPMIRALSPLLDLPAEVLVAGYEVRRVA